MNYKILEISTFDRREWNLLDLMHNPNINLSDTYASSYDGTKFWFKQDNPSASKCAVFSLLRKEHDYKVEHVHYSEKHDVLVKIKAQLEKPINIATAVVIPHTYNLHLVFLPNRLYENNLIYCGIIVHLNSDNKIESIGTTGAKFPLNTTDPRKLPFNQMSSAIFIKQQIWSVFSHELES